MSSHGVSSGRPRTIDVSLTSRDEHPVLAQDGSELRFVRVESDDAGAVTTFLREQDVRPAPREADVTALLGRSDAALFCAVRDARIEGLASCVKDGSSYRLVHFVIKAGRQDEVASRLVDLVEQAARDAGAVILATQTARDSKTYHLLRSCGFAVDWEEGDAADGRVVTLVDLLKTL
jgi:hypothetical protein